MRILDLDKDFPRGKHCFLYYNLKIFFAYPVKKDQTDIEWGDGMVSLREATKIQNYAWLHGLAPRVYGIVKVWFLRKWYLAQIVEVLYGEKAKSMEEAVNVYNKVAELGKIYGFEIIKKDVSLDDVIDGKLVDFNTFRFTKDHLEKVKKLYIENARYGKIYYHNVPEWGLKGSPRKNEDRVKYMKLDEIDFKDKSVLDLGCAGGFFCRYAKDRGASYVLGIDYKGKGSNNPILGALILSNELEYWDIEFLNRDLSDVNLWADIYFRGQMKNSSFFDIVFYLSMNYHIGIPPALADITKKLCIFEDNSKERNALPTLKKMFRKVKLVGRAKDHGDKPIYWCYV